MIKESNSIIGVSHLTVRNVGLGFVDVPGGKTSINIYFSGCSVHCSGCHAKTLWEPIDSDYTDHRGLIEEINKRVAYAEWVCFLGGEPTEQNDDAIRSLITWLKENGLKMCLYSGKEWNHPSEMGIWSVVDMIIVGPYVEEKRTGGWPASSNQKVWTKDRSDEWSLLKDM